MSKRPSGCHAFKQKTNDMVATKWSLIVQHQNDLVAVKSPSEKKMTLWPLSGFEMTWWLPNLQA